MVMRWGALSCLLATGLHTILAKELTSKNWNKETAGKQVFVKFLAPW